MRQFLVYVYSLFGRDASALKNQILHLHIEHQKAQKAVDNARVKLSRVKEQKLNDIGALKQHTLERTTRCVDKLDTKCIAEEAKVDQAYTKAKEKITEKRAITGHLKKVVGDLMETSLSVE